MLSFTYLRHFLLLCSSLTFIDMKTIKYFKPLTLAQKARLSKKKLKGYREKLKKITKTHTGFWIDKKAYQKYKKYINSKWWQAKREEALEYHGNRCGNCGSRFSLQVHHKHYKTLYKEQMCDLMLLCKPCHNEYHRK